MTALLVALTACFAPPAATRCIELATYDSRSECLQQVQAVRVAEKGARLSCRVRERGEGEGG